MRSKTLGACVAGALFAASCSSPTSESVSAEVTIREVAESKPAVPSEPSAQILREQRAFAVPAPLGVVQEDQGIAPIVLDLGPTTFNELGISITLDFDEYWRLDNAQPGSFDITRPGAGLGALLPAVTFHRPIGFAPPPLIAAGRLGAGTALWDARLDLETWIAAVPQVVVLAEGEIDVDGRRSRWWDVEVDPGLGPTLPSCQPGTCVELMWSGAYTHSVARDLERIRWYEIPDDQGPIIVFVSTEERDFGPVVADIDDLLERAELGPSAPLPIPDRVAYARAIEIPPNEAWLLAGVPGVSINAPNAARVIQRPGEVSVYRANRGNDAHAHSVIVPVATADGETFEDASEMVSAIIERAETVGEVISDTMLGYEATRIELRHDGDGFLVLSPPRLGYAQREALWPRRPIQRAWVFDSPLGPTMVSIAAESDFDFERALETFDWFLDGVQICGEAGGPTDSCPPAR